ncbi:MAG: hypothetical protein H6782_02540 [Candidatus Nomurabacteria bacterium]|nr:MAG: hypothetical protein H6782_02540 [Candidatus Nomurabacteria bacterium]
MLTEGLVLAVPPQSLAFIADTVGNNGVSIAETEYPDWMGDGGIFMKGAVLPKVVILRRTATLSAGETLQPG